MRWRPQSYRSIHLPPMPVLPCSPSARSGRLIQGSANATRARHLSSRRQCLRSLLAASASASPYPSLCSLSIARPLSLLVNRTCNGVHTVYLPGVLSLSSITPLSCAVSPLHVEGTPRAIRNTSHHSLYRGWLRCSQLARSNRH